VLEGEVRIEVSIRSQESGIFGQVTVAVQQPREILCFLLGQNSDRRGRDEGSECEAHTETESCRYKREDREVKRTPSDGTTAYNRQSRVESSRVE